MLADYDHCAAAACIYCAVAPGPSQSGGYQGVDNSLFIEVNISKGGTAG